MTEFERTLLKKLDSIGYTKKALVASIDTNDIKSKAYSEKAIKFQKLGLDPARLIELAAAARLEKETGLPISAAIERQKMSPFTRTSQRATVGNFNKSV